MTLLTPTRRKLLGNVTWLYALQGLNYLLPLAVLPYLIRVLGVERYGLVAFAQSFAQYFIILTDYGFNLSATNQIARMQNDREKVSRLFWSVILIKLTVMLLGILVMGSIVLAVPRFRPDAVLYLVAYGAVVGSVFFPIWLFQGMERMRYISLISGGAKLVSALLLFVFVHKQSDYIFALAIQSAGLLFAGIAGFIIAIRSFKLAWRMPSPAEIAETLRDGWHLFVSTAATMAYTNSNVFLVGIFAGNAQAGYFSGAEKIIRGMQGLLGPVTQTIYPHISALARESREYALSFVRTSLIWIGGVSFVASTLVLIFAAPIAHLIFGTLAAGCIPVLRWIAMLPFVIAVSNVLGIQTMVPFGLQRQLSRIYIAAGAGSLALSIPLIREYGAGGAGISVLVVETLIVCFMWRALKSKGVDTFRSAVEAMPVVARREKRFAGQETI
jgi:PST family polysaccharide transporter